MCIKWREQAIQSLAMECRMEKRNQNEAYKVAREAYPFRCCVVCGLQVQTCLTVAHLDHKAGSNLAWLCWTHHWMFDANFYPIKAIKLMRQHWQKTKGVPRRIPMIGAGLKAAATRKRSEIAKRAARTRADRQSQPGIL
jgi:hypothetical protein